MGIASSSNRSNESNASVPRTIAIAANERRIRGTRSISFEGVIARWLIRKTFGLCTHTCTRTRAYVTYLKYSPDFGEKWQVVEQIIPGGIRSMMLPDAAISFPIFSASRKLLGTRKTYPSSLYVRLCLYPCERCKSRIEAWSSYSCFRSINRPSRSR